MAIPIFQVYTRFTLAAFGAVTMASSLQNIRAQSEAFSPPRGIYTVKIAGKAEGQTQARTYFGIQLLPDPKFGGTVESSTGDTLKLSGLSSHASLDDPDRRLYVHVLSGDGRGFISDIEEAGENGLRCADEISDWVTPGTSIQIRPHSNISEVLGATNTYGLSAGSDAASADNLVIRDAEAERVYYFNSTRSRWEEQGIAADSSQALLRYPYGAYIIRRSAEPLRIVLGGRVTADPVLLPVRTGQNIFSMPINLSASLENLVTSSGDFSINGGLNSNDADLLTFDESSTGRRYGPFYYSENSGSSGWREVGVNASNAATQGLDLLSTLVLHRTGTDGYVRVEGSLAPNPSAPGLQPDPELGEAELTGVMKVDFPAQILRMPNLSLTLQTSSDLQNWRDTRNVSMNPSDNTVSFPLPPGQTRSFHRIKVTLIR